MKFNNALPASVALTLLVTAFGCTPPDNPNPGTNQPPQANAGADTVIELGWTANLDGSTSTDPDNGPSPLSYQWTIGSKPASSSLETSDIIAPNSATTSFVPDATGTYTMYLTVSDGAADNFDAVTVMVNDPTGDNELPVADAGNDVNVEFYGVAQLDGSGSYDDDGPQPLSLTWSFASVPHQSTITDADLSTTTGATPSFRGDKSGTYILTLTATDGLASTIDSVRVVMGQRPPDAVIEFSQPGGIYNSNIDIQLSAEGVNPSDIIYQIDGAAINLNDCNTGYNGGDIEVYRSMRITARYVRVDGTLSNVYFEDYDITNPNIYPANTDALNAWLGFEEEAILYVVCVKNSCFYPSQNNIPGFPFNCTVNCLPWTVNDSDGNGYIQITHTNTNLGAREVSFRYRFVNFDWVHSDGTSLQANAVIDTTIHESGAGRATSYGSGRSHPVITGDYNGTIKDSSRFQWDYKNAGSYLVSCSDSGCASGDTRHYYDTTNEEWYYNLNGEPVDSCPNH